MVLSQKNDVTFWVLGLSSEALFFSLSKLTVQGIANKQHPLVEMMSRLIPPRCDRNAKEIVLIKNPAVP